MIPDFGRLTPVAEMCGEDRDETLELEAMFEGARTYLQSHDWCEEISNSYFGFGVGGVVAVFLFHVNLKAGDEELLWVIDGDLPSAYLVVDNAAEATAALEIYADLMQDWVDAVRKGSGLEEVFPVDAPADEEHAELLEKRIRLLRGTIIPAARMASTDS